ncbi:MAG: UDP-N-acetylmuramoyl-L-alanine--D-glutamate ligase [Betaproteobacteria bacterium]
MHTLHGLKVLVLGLGASGLAMARWCNRQGAQVSVLDTRPAPPQAQALAQLVPAVRLLHSSLRAEVLDETGAQAVFISPGLSPAQVQPVVDAALQRAIAVGSEITLFAQALLDLQLQTPGEPEHGTPQVLAITGTNGKTTVTSLTGALVRRAGKTVAVAGNIGPTLLDTLTHAIDTETLPQVWVLELSSFQLHYAQDFEPTAAVVLNLSQDHLDWHPDLADYARCKAQIFGKNTLMVLNQDDEAVMAMLPAPLRSKQGVQLREHICFGAQAPSRAGDYGLEQTNGMVWLVRAMPADESLKKGRQAQAQELHIQRLMPADALRIHGRHNACNALAALALATSAGCAIGPLLYGLRDFAGEPHRLQSIGMLDGVEYFDDSKGTNVGATVAALGSLGLERKLVVILGGQGKGQDFGPLAEPVRRFARAVVLIGRDAALIGQALGGTGVPQAMAESMKDAVELASASAHTGDAVLMSPACASLDMFRDYGHRAQVFCDAVRAHALAHGNGLEWVA